MDHQWRFGALAVATLLTACATEVTSIKDGGEAVLDEAEGFLLMRIDTTRSLDSILITGPKDVVLTSADLRAGSNYVLVNLPAGDYEIRKVKLNDFFYYRLDDEELWKFSVREDVISYIGDLTFEGDIWGVSGYFGLLNRSSFALEYLEEKFPRLLQSHRVAFGGPGEDDFFEVVSAGRLPGQER